MTQSKSNHNWWRLNSSVASYWSREIPASFPRGHSLSHQALGLSSRSIFCFLQGRCLLCPASGPANRSPSQFSSPSTRRYLGPFYPQSPVQVLRLGEFSLHKRHLIYVLDLPPLPFPNLSLTLLKPAFLLPSASLHPPRPEPPTPGPRADFWTHVHQLGLPLLPLAEPPGLLLHLSLGWAAHRGRVGVQAHTGAQLSRWASQVASPDTTTPQSQLPRSPSTSHPAVGGAKGRTHRPAHSSGPAPSSTPPPSPQAPGSCPATAGSLTGGLRPSAHLGSYICPAPP